MVSQLLSEHLRWTSPRGISAQVIDLRTEVLLDREANLESVGKTGPLVVVDVKAKQCPFLKGLGVTPNPLRSFLHALV